MRVFVTDMLLVAGVLGFWLAISDWVTGAPSTLVSYYLAKYDGSTSGVILRSKVHLMGRGSTYDIKYSYIVADTAYTSNQINFLSNGSKSASETARRYPVDKIVTVYYDTSNPSFSVLEVTHLEFAVWLQLIAAILFGLASAALLPLGSKRKRKNML